MSLANKLMMTTGNAAGGNISSGRYVDDVFSTYLYIGNGSTQTINSGIDLAREGGLVWIKARNGGTDHALYDTARGATFDLASNSAAGQTTQSTGLTAFGNSGFSVGSLAKLNTNSSTYVSWTFRKAPKFFDVVTYTGNGVAGRQIAHSLGVQAGFVTVKSTGATGGWNSYHRSATGDLKLNLDSAQTASRAIVTAADASTFTVSGAANTNGVDYVAHLWAHNPSAEGIIQCGSYVGNGNASGPTVTLGWEPQFVMVKMVSGLDSYANWFAWDSMRGFTVNRDAYLNWDASAIEQWGTGGAIEQLIDPTSTGFKLAGIGGGGINNSGSTYIYLAIRRPNKPPTTGTEVYKPLLKVGNGATQYQYPGFQPDTYWGMFRDNYSSYSGLQDVLRGGNVLITSDTGIGAATAVKIGSVATGRVDFSNSDCNNLGSHLVDHFFRRAPGFLDVVCDTGTGVAHAIVHNLTKAPELIIRKSCSAATQWEVWHAALAPTERLVLNSNAAKTTDTAAWNSTLPTATQFTAGAGANVNANTATFVTHLFATLPGISKVGSYTGNGSSQTIDCGFSTGARFVLIKRTDSTGDWYVWDTARGIIPGNDPHLSLNTGAAEVTTDDSIDPANVGFVVNQVAATNINVAASSYIFLAIA